MLQQLTAASGAHVWAIGSTLFFVAAFLLVLFRVLTARRDELDALARLPLDDAHSTTQRPSTSPGAELPTEQGA